MKVKMKLDMDQVKQFGIEHGEKFGLALAVIILGVFVVKAVSRDTLPENLSPQTIKSNSTTADSNLKRLPAPPPDQDVKSIDFVNQISKEPARVAPSLEILPIEQEAFPDPVKRADPTEFAVEEVRAFWFRGAVPTSAVVGGNGAGGLAPTASPAPVVQTQPATGGLIPGRITGRPGSRTRPAQNPRPNPTPAPAPANSGLLGGGIGNGLGGQQQFPDGTFEPGPPGAGSADGRYGIIVTALIPWQKEREEYSFRFKNARRGAEAGNAPGKGPNSPSEIDIPQYTWCTLERADLTDGKTVVLDFGDIKTIGEEYHSPDPAVQAATRQAVKDFQIRAATTKKLEADEQTWAAQVPEVVKAEFLDRLFSLKMPPVLLRNWGAEAAHLPQIPLADSTVSPAAGEAPANAAPGATPAPGAQPGSGFDDPATAAAAASRRGPAQAGEKVQVAEAPYRLLRFRDFEVEPGHAYQYRVRMLLRNPNFGLEAQVLAKPSTAVVAYRATPWSDPSAPVLLPQNTRLLASNIDRPKHMEAKAKVGVFTFDIAQAVELIKEFDTELGSLVGTTVADQTIKNVADPVKREIHDMTANFRSPSVLLDFRGDEEKLPGPGNVTEPGEMLLLNDVDQPDNPQLIVINEAKDKPIIDWWRLTHIPPAAPAASAPAGKTPATTPSPGGLAPGGLQPGTPRNTTRRTGNR